MELLSITHILEEIPSTYVDTAGCMLYVRIAILRVTIFR